MKGIVFMGTADFAVPALEYLLSSQHRPQLVVTQPDRPAGRGGQIHASPVKEVAERHGLPILQPETFKANPALRRQFEALRMDLLIVAAYGKILPEWLLKLPRHGALNLHGSLLPAYRGAAPIQWAIIRGEKQTGVTLMEMVPELDAGNIIFSQKVPIDDNETYGELEARLRLLGPPLLARYLEMAEKGEHPPSTPQNPQAVTFAPSLKTGDTQIDWSRSAGDIHNQVRGLNPKPLAFTTFRGKKLKIVKTRLDPATPTPGPAAAVSSDAQGLHVRCGEGALLIEELIPESRGLQDGRAFANGARLQLGDRFE